MYPIFSLLRRLAATHIYATEPMLEVIDGTYHIRLDRSSDYLNLTTLKWDGASKAVPFSAMEVSSDSPVAAAISLSKRENEIAEKVRARDIVYTMVAGPEEEVALPEGRVRRRCTYALIRGVYRASSTALVQQRIKATQELQFRKLPPGTVRL